MASIKITDVHKTFETAYGTKEALKGVSMEIPEEQCTIISGENGSGKSLLMSIIANLEEADSGSVETASRVGLVFQEAETQILGETVREDIAFGPKNLGWKKERVALAVEDALKSTGLEDKADSPARFLSGGEKRRLAVACMLAMDLNILILDEPYANLDFGGVRQVNALIKELLQKKKTIVILTHELEKCMALAQKFIVLFRGEKVFDGSTQEGLKQNLEQWNIHNPASSYTKIEDMLW